MSTMYNPEASRMFLKSHPGVFEFMHQQLFSVNETSLHLNYTKYQITHPNTALHVMPFKNKKYNHLFTIFKNVFY